MRHGDRRSVRAQRSNRHGQLMSVDNSGGEEPTVVGGMRIVINRFLPPGKIYRFGAEIHAHDPRDAASVADAFNAAYALIRTDPPCLLNKQTGEIEDLELQVMLVM